MGILNLVILALVGFFQNMVFTFVSRSRNGGNVKKHLVAALFSNGIWFITTFVLILPEVWEAVKQGDKQIIIITGIVYAISTALGSCTMMKINLGHWHVPYLTETGKSKVGAR